MRKAKRTQKAVRSSRLLGRAKLEAMVEEAIVDSYNESEQITCLFTMIEENLEVPFETVILGAPVEVERVDLRAGNQIVAICMRGRLRQPIPILDLPLPSPAPPGAEWIDAYRFWIRND